MNQFLKDVKEVYNFVAEFEGEVSHIILQDDNFAVDLYDNWEDFVREYSSADFENATMTQDMKMVELQFSCSSSSFKKIK